MKQLLFVILALAVTPLIFDNAFAQTTIDVGESTPCFMNYTASTEMWSNCGMETDPLGAVTLPLSGSQGILFTNCHRIDHVSCVHKISNCNLSCCNRNCNVTNVILFNSKRFLQFPYPDDCNSCSCWNLLRLCCRE